MNNCLTIEDIEKYISGTLKGKELNHIEVHLKMCERCRDECSSIISTYEDDEIWAFDSINTDDAKMIMDKIYKLSLFDNVKIHSKKIFGLIHKKLRIFIDARKRYFTRKNYRVLTSNGQHYYPWLTSQSRIPCVVLARKKHCESPNENIVVYKQFSSLKTEIFIEKSKANAIDLLINTIGKTKMSDSTYIEISANNSLLVRPIKGGYAFIEGLPFAYFHMVLKKNSVSMGSFDFEITSQGLIEK